MSAFASDDRYRQELDRVGWARVERVIPTELCAQLVAVIRDELGVPVDEPERWAEYGKWDVVPVWGHQAQWDIRQHPDLHRVWAALCGTDQLWVSLDMVRFTPTWQPGFLEPLPIHWDQNPHGAPILQGVVALTDTARGQGGFRCVPSLFRDRTAWPKEPIERPWGEEWQPPLADREVVEVPAGAGDLIAWDARLPHANSKNVSDRPRIAFYVQMFPAPANEEERQLRIELWRTGRSHPAWRGRPGADRIGPWPPATLTPLGRRLLGVDLWDAARAET